MRFLPGNAQHIGDRRTQQDSFAFTDPDDYAFVRHAGFLGVVCDGMGGMEHGDAASRTAVQAFLAAYQRKTPSESIPAALERSTREANAQVVALAHSFGLSDGMGTTLVAAALHENELYYVSVGDSALFHVSGSMLRMVNRPHVLANLLNLAVARGVLSREDADRHPEREALTSFIGAESLTEIDRNVDPLPLHGGDTILLASDGLFKTLNPDEIQMVLNGDPQSWPKVLVAATVEKQREYQDNVTVLSMTAEFDARARFDNLPAPVTLATGAEWAALKEQAPPAAVEHTVLLPPPLPLGTGTRVSTHPPLSSPPPIPDSLFSESTRENGRDPSHPPPLIAATNGPASPLHIGTPLAIQTLGMQVAHVASLPNAPLGPSDQRRPPASKGLWLVILLLLALAAAAGGWWYISRHAHGPDGTVQILRPNLASGNLRWTAPLGEITAAFPNGGSLNLGGPMATAGGLAFSAAGMDPYLHGFDVETGAEIWKAELPASAQSTPMTYEYHGKQYLVICAGGHGKMGDSVVAFAIP